MAYLAFDEFGAIRPEAPAAPRADAPTDSSRLSPLEWAVVALARNDSFASLREPGRLSVALGQLFGAKTNPRLADPRLEALRRMAVLSWHHRFAVPAREVRDFIAAGFTADQYETMLGSISAAGQKRGRLA